MSKENFKLSCQSVMTFLYIFAHMKEEEKLHWKVCLKPELSEISDIKVNYKQAPKFINEIKNFWFEDYPKIYRQKK